jgi:hypothetical protein
MSTKNQMKLFLLLRLEQAPQLMLPICAPTKLLACAVRWELESFPTHVGLITKYFELRYSEESPTVYFKGTQWITRCGLSTVCTKSRGRRTRKEPLRSVRPSPRIHLERKNPNKDGSRLLEPRATVWLGSARPVLDELLLSRAEPSQAEPRQHYILVPV